MQTGHAVYQGHVGHLRLIPQRHGFNYALALYWLDCQHLNSVSLAQVGIKYERFGALSYRRRDYLPGRTDLHDAVCDKIAHLGGTTRPAQIFMLTPLANWGLYFSPLTLYYAYDQSGQFCYLLAEVSNTPWNERHYYLQTIMPGQQHYQHDKAFHVSPFNPINMQYHWQLPAPDHALTCSITNTQNGQQVFSAWFSLQRQQLTAKWRQQWLIRQPWQNVLVVWRIYWQALKLYFKKVPVHAHPKTKDNKS